MDIKLYLFCLSVTTSYIHKTKWLIVDINIISIQQPLYFFCSNRKPNLQCFFSFFTAGDYAINCSTTYTCSHVERGDNRKCHGGIMLFSPWNQRIFGLWKQGQEDSWLQLDWLIIFHIFIFTDFNSIFMADASWGTFEHNILSSSKGNP